MGELTRRTFLQTSALAALGATATAPAATPGAGETLNVGLVGTGGRCLHLLKSLVKLPGVRVTAVCDVYEPNRARAAAAVEGKPFGTAHAHAVFERKDVDAVIIATPEHHHAAQTVAACQAGKDVYVEKPLTHSITEGQAIIEAVARTNRVVQVGTQQRSMPHMQKAREMVRAGKLGQVHKARMTWNRNSDRIGVRPDKPTVDPTKLDWQLFLGSAKAQPFDEYRYRQWRAMYDFGGGLLTDLMVHHLDIVHWCLDLRHPLKAMSVGSNRFSRDLWEWPDTVQTLLTYPDGVQAHFEGTFSNARCGEMIELMGTHGTLYLDRGRLEFTPERPSKDAAEELVLGSGPKGKDFYDQPDGELLHLQNWVECVRSRKAPNSPVESGVQSAAAAHLANQSVRSGQAAEWKNGS